MSLILRSSCFICYSLDGLKKWCAEMEGTWAWFYTKESSWRRGRGWGWRRGRDWRVKALKGMRWECSREGTSLEKENWSPISWDWGNDMEVVSLTYLGWVGAGQKVEEFQTKGLRELEGKDLPLWVKAMGEGEKRKGSGSRMRGLSRDQGLRQVQRGWWLSWWGCLSFYLPVCSAL